jgi:hypothetical protein
MSPTNQPKGRTPFICAPGVPICLRFKSRQGPPHSSFSGCIHEKLIRTLATQKSEFLPKKWKNRMESYRWMTGKHCLAGWWLVAAGVYLDQVQAQLLAADSPFHHTTHNNPIYDYSKEYQRHREDGSSLFLTFQGKGSSFMLRMHCTVVYTKITDVIHSHHRVLYTQSGDCRFLAYIPS